MPSFEAVRGAAILGVLAALAAPGTARAACAVTAVTPHADLAVSNSPKFRWTGNCALYRVSFSPSGGFGADRVATAWSTTRHHQYTEDVWEGFQLGDWADGVSWKVQGRDAVGALSQTTVQRITMDPDIDDDGVSVGAGDCDDADPAVHPGAVELCNGVDEDCDGVIPDETDADGDGFTGCGGDCDDTERFTNPADLDECGDGVDNDCDGYVDGGGAVGCASPRDVLGVIVIVVDTLRGDRVGCGEELGLMPYIEAQAEGGACFQDARSTAPWTKPGTVSILSGLTPGSHGMGPALNVLPEDVLIAPDLFRDHGWVSGQASSNSLAARGGISLRFDVNETFAADVTDIERDRQIVDEADDFIDDLGLTRSTPFFLHYQFFAPHAPFCPEGSDLTVLGEYDFCDGDQIGEIQAAVMDGNDELVERALLLYDLETTWVDEKVAELLAAFDARGLLDHTLVVLTADHGEEFKEHGGWGHSTAVTREQVHVPLVMWGPGVPEGRVVPTTVSTIDILPTALDYAELTTDTVFEGRSLKSLVEPGAADTTDRAYSTLEEVAGVTTGIAATAEDGSVWTLIEKPGPTYALYRDETDPLQLTDLYGTPEGSAAQDFLATMLDPASYTWEEWVDAYYGAP